MHASCKNTNNTTDFAITQLENDSACPDKSVEFIPSISKKVERFYKSIEITEPLKCNSTSTRLCFKKAESLYIDQDEGSGYLKLFLTHFRK